MIFVTVGTHEQPFNRLIEYVDHLKRDSVIQEEVVIQTGYSTYQPEYCTWEKWFSYQEMTQYVNKARIIITHGAPASFIMPLQIGKIPIVVPRKQAYREHVNDHQVAFTHAVAERMGSIIVAEDIKTLGDAIGRYDEIMKGMRCGLKSNNARFNDALGKIVDRLFEGKKND